MTTATSTRVARDSLVYLGPEGTFTHAATSALETVGAGTPRIPLSNVRDVLEHVEGELAQFGVVPIENSVEGEVIPTIDQLLFNTEKILVREEVVVDVSFHAFKRAEYVAAASATAYSHRHALAQCRGYLDRHQLAPTEADSTAAACKAVAASDDPEALAIASPSAGPLYGLVAVDESIEDFKGAQTRFVLLSRYLANPTSARFKTMIVVTPADDRAGFLSSMIGAFSERGIDISHLGTRPLRTDLGAYCFLLTVIGHVRDPLLASALMDVLRLGASIKLLGCYVASDAGRVTAPFTGQPRGSLSLRDAGTRLNRLFAPPIADAGD